MFHSQGQEWTHYMQKVAFEEIDAQMLKVMLYDLRTRTELSVMCVDGDVEDRDGGEFRKGR